jgi:hypothetical protein
MAISACLMDLGLMDLGLMDLGLMDPGSWIRASKIWE